MTPKTDNEELELLTPRVKEGTRLRLMVTKEDAALVTKGPGYKGQVQDAITGELFDIWGAACTTTFPNGNGCFCDAIAERIEEE